MTFSVHRMKSLLHPGMPMSCTLERSEFARGNPNSKTGLTQSVASESTPDEGSDPRRNDARDLTTHAVMVGMSGSEKTGLATALLEEAAIDGNPAILY